jgi:large subunit ribosomal protein L13
MKTFVPDARDIKRSWYLIDAAGQTLGRLAVTIANLLRGRGSPLYTPHVDTGHYVVVVNAEKVKVTGRKETGKEYRRYTGYRSGQRLVPLGIMRAAHPERIIAHAVKGMLPRNTLSRGMYRRLKVYAGSNHPHTAQNPIPMKPA